MASPANALVSHLLGTTSITNLVGQRIYPVVTNISEETYPLIVFRISEVATIDTYGGSTPLTSCKVELAVIATAYSDADTVGYALIAALDSTSGTWGGTTVQGCFLDSDGVSDELEQSSESESLNQYIKTLSFTLWFVNQ